MSGHTRNKRSEIDNESGKLPKRFYFFFIYGLRKWFPCRCKCDKTEGNASQGLCDFNKAIEYDERHLEIAKEVGDKDGEGRAYGRLGFAYYNLGDFQKAIQYNERHLKIAKEVGNKAGEGGAYDNLCNAYQSFVKPKVFPRKSKDKFLFCLLHPY